MATFINNPRKVYLAGPMSGLPNFNFPAFHEAAEVLRRDGWIVFNPAEKDGEVVEGTKAYASGDHMAVQEEGFNFREAYAWDVCKVIEADAICLLPGWERSPGACGEYYVARAMQRHYPTYEVILYEDYINTEEAKAA